MAGRSVIPGMRVRGPDTERTCRHRSSHVKAAPALGQPGLW